MTAGPPPRATVPIEYLLDVGRRHALERVQATLARLGGELDEELLAVERDIHDACAGRSVAEVAGQHLVASGGKRLRPLATLLASRVAGPLDARAARAARTLAGAAELVHAATLLHDDVIDAADLRRGAPTARLLFGNAASVLSGDLLLVRALGAITSVDPGGLLAEMLAVLEAMVEAESIQLALRGSPDANLGQYLQIVGGKTASLFRFCMSSGAAVARVPAAERSALCAYGFELGVAFQIVDDALDLEADAATIGKAALADLREGKATYPILVALERFPALREELGRFLDAEAGAEELSRLGARLVEAVRRGDGVSRAREEARRRGEVAIAALEVLPASPARGALEVVARSMTTRRT